MGKDKMRIMRTNRKRKRRIIGHPFSKDPHIMLGLKITKV